MIGVDCSPSRSVSWLATPRTESEVHAMTAASSQQQMPQRRLMRLALGCALAACSILTAGCHESTEPAAGARATAATPQAAPHDMVLHRVSWPAANRLDVEARAALPEAARLAVDESPVPVLVVAEPGWLAVSRVMTRGSWYALAAHANGLSLAIRGNRLAHRYADIPPAQGPHRVRNQPAFITDNAHIWSATWLEGGVSYSIELECASADDGRCDDDAELRQLASRLRYVGGAAQRSTP